MPNSEVKIKKDHVLPGNPLGMIATFVFLIETVATVSLHAVSDKPYAAYLVWFIIIFPSVIALLFFVLLWFKREALYAPMDFGDSATFKELILNKMDRIEAKQEVSVIDRNTDLRDIFQTIERLLSLNDAWSAIGVGRAFLRQCEYEKAMQIFEHVKSKIPKSDDLYYKPLANIAYAKIGMNKFDEAIDALEEVKKIKRGKYFGPWHSLALAYAYYRSNKHDDFNRQMIQTKELNGSDLDKTYFARLYPEIADEINKL